MKTLHVDLGDRSYPIFIGQGLLENSLENKQLIVPYVKGKQVIIVSNETIAPLYLAKAEQLFSSYKVASVILKDGEEFKNIEGMLPIIDAMMAKNIDRRVTLVALGGGVIGDITGFAAAIYRRGVNFIQIPTTLLAQVDSSVGGKTGVNHPLGKNMIGAFFQPQCVIADTNTLNTLDDRQLSSGLAEVIKYALIDDIKFLDWIEKNVGKLLNRKSEELIYAIEKSCNDKARIVAMDEKETGVRALLNLGHTFGHAIETAKGYGNCLHGEAIAIGMIMAADLSRRHGWIDEQAITRIINLFKKSNLPVRLPEGISAKQMLDLMAGDKKVLDGDLHLVLFKQQAISFISADYDTHKLQQTIDSFVSNARG
ncbi:MAG: 3-dehydroquinate synthase [Pseudomonadota bacterium]